MSSALAMVSPRGAGGGRLILVSGRVSGFGALGYKEWLPFVVCVAFVLQVGFGGVGEFWCWACFFVSVGFVRCM